MNRLPRRDDETCDLCHRVADVEYRLLRPFGMVRFWCSLHARTILDRSPAADFERLETPLDRLHELVSI